MKRQTVVNLVGYTLAFSVLGFVIWREWKPGDPSGLAAVWQRHVIEGQPANLVFLGLAVAAMTYALTLTLVRWYLLVRAQDLPFRLVDAFRLGLFGFFWNTFLPGSVGGDVAKAAFLARGQSRRTVAVATVIMDRIIALWGLVWFVAALGSAFWLLGQFDGLDPRARAAAERVVSIAGGLVVVSVVVWLLLGLLPPHQAERFAGRLEGLPRVGASVAEFWRAVWMYRCRQKSVAYALLLSWAGHVGFVFAFYCSARVLWNETAPMPALVVHFLIVPIGLVIQAMPLFPGGAGIGEAGFGGLYQWFAGADAVAVGVAGSLVQRVITWGVGVVSLGVSLWLARVSRPAPAPAPAEETPVGVSGLSMSCAANSP